MKKRVTYKSLKAGTVFEMKLKEDKFCLGQILESDSVFYICVYDGIDISGGSDIQDITNRTMKLIGRTTDALFYNGDWKVLGDAPLPSIYPRPLHVVFTPSGLELHDFDGRFVRQAHEHDEERFGFKLSVTPIRFVKAMLDLYGIEPYSADYSRLLVEDAARRTAAHI